MLSQAEQEALIAPCGMNCALCTAYQARALELKKKGIQWKYCPGCVPRGENCLHMRKSCETLGSGRLRFCFQCETFPCARLKRLDTRYRTRYGMSMIDNLRMIQNQGMETFLSVQRQAWTCKRCGNALLTCHRGLCLSCDLEALKQNRRLRGEHPSTDAEP